MPSGTPIRIASPNPVSTRRSVAMMLSSRPRSFHRGPKLRATSSGDGRITGEIRRCSGVAAERGEEPEHEDQPDRARSDEPTHLRRRQDAKVEELRHDIGIPGQTVGHIPSLAGRQPYFGDSSG